MYQIESKNRQNSKNHPLNPHAVNCLPKIRRLSVAIFAIVGLSGIGGLLSPAQAANVTDINELVSQAVTTHPLVGAAKSEEQATAEGINAAKLNLYPQPSISSSYDKNDGMITRAGLRQPLWTGGKLTANVNRAIYDDKAATANILEQQNTVAKNTIDVWQSYIYAIALQGLYVKDLQSLNEFETMMKRRVDQGVSARIDLDLVTNRILQDQNAYQGAVQQQRIAAARLSQMIGEPVNDNGTQNIPLNQMAKYVKAQSTDFEQLAFSQVSFNNPSVIKQQFQVEAAKQDVKAQQAAQYPTVYAQYEHLYYHKDHKDDGQFSLGLSYDPGAGFSNMALARASQARVQSLSQTQEAARRTVMEDIQTQYQQFVSAKDQETSLIAAVAGAQIVVDSYRRQFIAGRKSWLEVLNAVKEKAGYEQQLLQIQSQMLAAFYKLQVEFGRMPWQNNNLLYQPVNEYHPYLEFKDWLKQQSNVIESHLTTNDTANNNVTGNDTTSNDTTSQGSNQIASQDLNQNFSQLSTSANEPQLSQENQNSLSENSQSKTPSIASTPVDNKQIENSLSEEQIKPSLTQSQPQPVSPEVPTTPPTTTSNEGLTLASEANQSSTTNQSSETSLPTPVIPVIASPSASPMLQTSPSTLSLSETKKLLVPPSDVNLSKDAIQADTAQADVTQTDTAQSDSQLQPSLPAIEAGNITEDELSNHQILMVAVVDNLPPL